MSYINANNETFRMNLQWSTPRLYVAAVHAANVSDWTVKTDDFFPYAGMSRVCACLCLGACAFPCGCMCMRVYGGCVCARFLSCARQSACAYSRVPCVCM